MTHNSTERWQLAIGLFYGLFLFCSAFSIAAAQITLAISGTLFLVIVAVRKQAAWSQPLRLWYLLAGAYVGWLIVAALAGPTPLASISALREEWLFVAVAVGIHLWRRQETGVKLIMFLATGLLLAATLGIVQHFTGLYLGDNQVLHTLGGNYRLSGNFSHPLTYGNYITVATLFVLTYRIAVGRPAKQWQTWLLNAASVAGLAASVMTNSRGPVLALGIGLIALGLVRRKVAWTLTLLVGLLTVAALSSSGLTEALTLRFRNDLNAQDKVGRLFIWKTSLDMIGQEPLTGTAPGRFGEVYAGYLEPGEERFAQGHAHSDMLNIAASAGLPALFFYLALWGFSLHLFWRGTRTVRAGPVDRGLSLAALVASITFFVCSLSEAAFADEEVRQLLMICWAAGLAAAHRIESGTAEPSVTAGESEQSG